MQQICISLFTEQIPKQTLNAHWAPGTAPWAYRTVAKIPAISKALFWWVDISKSKLVNILQVL